jgi:hypothetical protein
VKLGPVPDQVIRVSIVFAVVIAALIGARIRFVPPTFGEKGHYRLASVDSVASRPTHYAGLQVCIECHVDIGEKKAASYHRGLSCEVCHGAAANHAAAPDEVKPAIPRDRQACLYCHEYLPSRPTGFPQVIERMHNPMEACVSCHNPHDPTPPTAPGACSACHATIARAKAVSRHATLACETCHEVPPEHKENPRAFLPRKPTTREFCGQCHAESAAVSAGIPRVDMATHGNRFLCWQCHYPHDPGSN